MMERLIPVFLGMLLVGGGLFVLSDAERMQAARSYFGLSTKEASLNEVERLQPQAMEAEIARLSALPVPGVEVPEGAEPVELGVLASRAGDCAMVSGGSLRTPKERARAGVMRYLLVLGATAADPESPLVEPRVRPLGERLAAGPMKLAKSTDAETGALLAEFHAVYRDVNHPLYHGLQLYPQTFDAMDFEKLVDRMAKSPKEILSCASAATLPAPPEAAENGTASN